MVSDSHTEHFVRLPFPPRTVDNVLSVRREARSFYIAALKSQMLKGRWFITAVPSSEVDPGSRKNAHEYARSSNHPPRFPAAFGHRCMLGRRI